MVQILRTCSVGIIDSIVQMRRCSGLTTPAKRLGRTGMSREFNLPDTEIEPHGLAASTPQHGLHTEVEMELQPRLHSIRQPHRKLDTLARGA